MFRSALALMLVCAAVPAVAQNIISAKAGLIHLAEGEVLWNGEAVHPDGDRFATMKEGDTLATQDGRAEILLNPGTLLRMAENSSFQLIQATFEDTKLRLVSGSTMIEVDNLDKESTLQIEVEGKPIHLVKRGLYEFRAGGAGAVRVYDGEVQVPALDGQATKVKDGREMAFNELEPRKFDKEITTALYRWSARRARTLAAVAEDPGSRSYAGAYNGGPAYGGNFTGWRFSYVCNCYFYYMPGMYSPFANVIYVQPPIIYSAPGFGGFPSSGDISGGVRTSAASASGTVSSGGGGAMPAAAAPAATSTNSAGRRR